MGLLLWMLPDNGSLWEVSTFRKARSPPTPPDSLLLLGAFDALTPLEQLLSV